MARTLRVLLLITAAAGALAPAARAQDSATVVVGPEYRAGGLQRFLWGSNWRHLWTRPVRVEVLDPDTFAGGLTPLRAGGDFASNTLHLLGADGRRYVFRSINKNVSKGLGPEFEGTLVEWVVQDQVSASHPGAPRLAAPLLQAAGILHAPPRMVVMKDRASLGLCRERFAGLVGHIEERADENDPDDPQDEDDVDAGNDEPAQTGGEEEAARADPLDESCGVPTREGQLDGPAFAGAVRVKGTDEFLDDLEDSPVNRLDSREYLAARLMDIYMGDWDRHEDQWRWARFDQGGLRVWRPVPRDRDNAFVNHEGVLLSLGRSVFVRNVRFDTEFPSLTGLTVQAEPLDRRLLSDLPRPAWDSVVAGLQARLTDDAIDRAISALPPEYQRGEREQLATFLRARRDRLPRLADLFYRRLAQNVDVHATDADEVAVIDRHTDGSVEVTLTGEDDGRRWVTYNRRFLPHETDDVRLYLQGGDDQAVVRGAGHGVGIRVIGGGGDDVLQDSSRSSGVRFYDHRGDNRFVRGRGTAVDRRPWEAPVDTSTIGGQRTWRDWGWSTSTFSPYVDWKRGAGPVVGGGPAMKKYGFRREPHAWRGHARFGWAPLQPGRFLVSATGDLHPENRRHWYSLDSYASNMENVRFFGFGNDTGEEDVPRELRDTWLRQVRVEPSLHLPLTRRGNLELGPVLQWTDPELEEGSPLELERPLGADATGLAGVRAELELDGRDVPNFPRRGWRLETGGSAYPAVWDAERAFGEAHAMAATYLSFGAGPILALRAGGKRVWGEFPFHEAAFLGGGSTLRGFTGQRFAGDAMAFGGAELRMPLFRMNFIARGVFGVMGLMDAGRVWYDGESDGELHTAVGGGAFYHFAGQTVTVTAAQGERLSVNFGFGMPF